MVFPKTLSSVRVSARWIQPIHLRSILITIRWKVIKIYNILEAGSFPISKQGKTAPLHCAWQTPLKWHRYLCVFFILISPLYSVQNVVLQHYSSQGSKTYRSSVHHLLVEIITHCSLILSLRLCQLLHPDSYCMSSRCSQVHTLIVLLWYFFDQVAHFISIYIKKCLNKDISHLSQVT